MTDLSQIKPTDRTIEILHPRTDEPIGIRVTLMSIDDERMIKAKRAITDKRLHLEQRAKSFKSTDLEDNKTSLLATAVIDWEWYNPTGNEDAKDFDRNAMPEWNSSVPDFSRRNVQAILSDPGMSWFTDQINEAVGETKAFF
jgi:hypothetical protein